MCKLVKQGGMMNAKLTNVMIMIGVVCSLGICPVTLFAADNNVNGQVGAWTNGAIWSLGVEPISTDNVQIYNSGYAIITEEGEVCNDLRLGLVKTGTVEITSGSLAIGYDLALGYDVGGYGAVIQSGGNVTISHAVYFGRTAGGEGAYTLSGGTVTNLNNWYIAAKTNSSGTITVSGDSHLHAGNLYLGENGEATMEQSGGTVTVDDALNIGETAGMGVGSYKLDGGNLLGRLRVGRHGIGTFTQNGGTNQTFLSSSEFRVGYYVDGTGTYNLSGGTLIVSNQVMVGYQGDGTFNFGDANSTGIFKESGTTHLFIGYSAGSEGTLRGWGIVNLTGSLYNMGRVIADGYGTDRTLDFSSMNGMIQNNRANAGNDGWFAQNHGKLTLPPLSINGGHNYWGEDGDLDLINAVDILQVSGGGIVNGSLFAPDYSSIPPGLILLNVWEFTNATFTAEFTFLYDEASLSSQNLDETNLSVWRYDGSNWVDVTATFDATNNKITTTVVSPGMFAIGRRPVGTTVIIK